MYSHFNYVMASNALEFLIMDDPWNLAMSHLMEWTFHFNLALFLLLSESPVYITQFI